MLIVFGSCIVDVFFLTAEMPAPDTAVHVGGHLVAAGGKGANQAVAATRAGADTCFFGTTGKDVHGDFLHTALARAGISNMAITRLDVPTGLASIFVDHVDGTHRAVVSQGANASATQANIDAQCINSASTLLVQGELPWRETAALLARAKANGMRTVLNLAPVNPDAVDALADVDVLVINEHEARTLALAMNIGATDMTTLLTELRKPFSYEVVITLGGEGALFSDAGQIFHASALPEQVVDTLGAGDAFTGYLAASLDLGVDMAGSIRAALVAGSLTCTDYGAQTAIPLRSTVQQRAADVHIRAA